ncbi:hypothetical protein ACKC9G_01315 [Pokkaliibacter sp. CJK22405]|uniref:hypothetical protein n=1 Tax=Pokkaliibacter sp. CJK22405 TaxID=3384615 RepID=UPI003984D0A7
MIDLSQRITKKVENYHFIGFYNRLKKINKKSGTSNSAQYHFEKKFYRSLFLDKSNINFMILGDIDLLLNFENSELYKKHRLYFLLAMSKEARKLEPFRRHFLIEMSNLPKYLKVELRRKDIDAISEEVRGRCNDVFSYKIFSRITKAVEYNPDSWNAYNYLSLFSPKVCPYCNLDQTPTLTELLGRNKIKYTLRPPIDHFLSKDHFPFFSLSVRNLIPSCTTCNSSLKRDINFKEILHISPSARGLGLSSNFSIRLTSNDMLLKAIEDIYNQDKIDYEKFSITFESDCDLSKQNIDTFKIIERYNSIKEQYRFFIEKIPALTSERISSLMLLLGFSSEKKAIEYFLEFDTDPDKFCDVPLSLLKNDLVRQYLN